MKKFASLIVCVVLAFSASLPAFADVSPSLTVSAVCEIGASPYDESEVINATKSARFTGEVEFAGQNLLYWDFTYVDEFVSLSQSLFEEAKEEALDKKSLLKAAYAIAEANDPESPECAQAMKDYSDFDVVSYANTLYNDWSYEGILLFVKNIKDAFDALEASDFADSYFNRQMSCYSWTRYNIVKADFLVNDVTSYLPSLLSGMTGISIETILKISETCYISLWDLLSDKYQVAFATKLFHTYGYNLADEIIDESFGCTLNDLDIEP